MWDYSTTSIRFCDVNVSVLFVIEKEKPIIHDIIGNDEWADEILVRKIVRFVC